jgi:hypothetical protein
VKWISNLNDWVHFDIDATQFWIGILSLGLLHFWGVCNTYCFHPKHSSTASTPRTTSRPNVRLFEQGTIVGAS